MFCKMGKPSIYYSLELTSKQLLQYLDVNLKMKNPDKVLIHLETNIL